MKRHAMQIALVAVVALMLGSGVGLARSNNWTIVGTWSHWEEFSWLLVVTPGTSAAVGQLDMESIAWDPSFGGKLPALRTTAPKGVWEKVNQRENKYTWVAYGLSATGQPVYAMRASGGVTTAGCDRVDITGTLELFGVKQGVWSPAPFLCIPISEFATRMPVVVVQRLRRQRAARHASLDVVIAPGAATAAALLCAGSLSRS